MNLLVNLYFSLSIAFGADSKKNTTVDQQLCLTPNSHVKMFASSFRSGVLERSQNLALSGSAFSKSESIKADDDLDLVSKITAKFQSGCKLLVGLYTSKECLLIAPIAKKYGAIIISPTCGHPDIVQNNETIFTLVPSLEKYISKANDLFIKKYQPTDDVLVLYQPSDLYSNKSFNSFLKSFSKKYTEIKVDNDGEIYSEDLPKLEKKYFAVYILTYPVVAAKILDQLKSKNFISNKMILIGSSSWSFDTSVLVKYRKTIESFADAIIPEIEAPSNLTSSSFYTNFINKYNEKPLGIHLMSFDATSIAIQCLKSNKEKTNEEIKKCLYKKPFHGITGKIIFNRTSPFSEREIFLSDLNKKLKDQELQYEH